jgi:hypothetical protein
LYFFRVRAALHLPPAESASSDDDQTIAQQQQQHMHQHAPELSAAHCDELAPTSPGWPLSLQRVMRRCWLSEDEVTRIQVCFTEFVCSSSSSSSSSHFLNV